jgi:hypothetical protein
VLAAHAPIVVPSPSKVEAAKSILATLGSFSFSATPLSASLLPLAAAGSLTLWHALSADAVLDEAQGYPISTASVPPWIVTLKRSASTKERDMAPKMPAAGAASPSLQGQLAASTLYLSPFNDPFKGAKSLKRPVVPGATIPWGCYPELLTTVREPFHPAFTGEVKPAHSSGDTTARAHLFDEVVTYAMLGTLGSFFRDVPDGSHRFFRAPPYAFALAAFPHVGYLVAVEWVGKLLVSVVSEPFFLGSDAHAAAVARLPDCDFSSNYFDIPVDAVRVAAWPDDEPVTPAAPPVSPAAPDDKRPAAVIWRVEAPAAGAADQNFFKILRGVGFDAAFFRRIFAVYARYAAARADATAPPPPALLDAALLFGSGEVCVRMPWAFGRDAEVSDLGAGLGAGGVAVAPVAAAIVWLARHGLLYVDLREPNVRVDDATGAVALVDYDDMLLVAAPPATCDELIEMLQGAGALYAGRADEPGARTAVVDALAAAWDA